MKRIIIILALVLLSTSQVLVFAQEVKGSEGSASSEISAENGPEMWKYIAAALAVGISCIAGGIAVGQIGAAAMGAMSENPELSGKALPYAGLAEGICLWGFLVALLILVLN
ncbi:MAG: ATP synthase subunit C [Treponema sp.]|jgi:V/A-type H+-transporting ATPase subunit K|nr:ATP synthase subunit C [Treponema sp.]